VRRWCGNTNHFFGGPQANHIRPEATRSFLGSITAGEEDRVHVLYVALNANGLQIRRHYLSELRDLRLGKLGKRPDLDWQGARWIAGFL